MRRAFLPLLSTTWLCIMTYAFGGVFGAEARAAGAVGATVWVALSEAEGAYAETAAALKAAFERGGLAPAALVTAHWRELASGSRPTPRLIVAVGVGAMRGMAEIERKAPLLAVLVPRAAYERYALAAGERPHSAVWLDQPPPRQLELLRRALPDRQRIGMLFGPESRASQPAFQRAAAERGRTLAAGQAETAEALSGSLQRVLEDSDVLLALPDPLIYNGATIQNILAAAYRRRIPLAGFSPALVKAGAFVALYSTPAQVGEQAGEIARALLAGRPLPAAQAPRDFMVGVNAHVARSLGIAVDDASAEAWRAALRAAERAP